MRKIFLLTIIFFLCFQKILCHNIDQITSFNNEQMIVEYDMHSGSIFHFEGKLYVNTAYRFTEYMIHPNGKLEQVSTLERKAGVFEKGVVDGNRYFALTANNQTENYDLLVYDISVTPIRYIGTYPTGISRFYSVAFFSTDSHILVSDPLRNRTVKFKKSDFSRDGFIDIIPRFSIRDGNLLIVPSIPSIHFYEIKDMETLEMELLASLNIPDVEVRNLKLQDDLLIVTLFKGAMIVDISDILEPKILHEIIINGQFQFVSALYGDDRIFLTMSGSYLWVFEKDVNGDFKLTHEMSCFINSDYNIYYYSPYLYWNSFDGLRIIDVLDGYKEVEKYGNNFFRFLNNVKLMNNEIFYHYFNPLLNQVEICSTLENKVIFQIPNSESESMLDFGYNHEFLYVLTTQDNIYSTFKIYKVNDNGIDYIKSIPLEDEIISNFLIVNNQVFFGQRNNNRTFVYDFDGLDIKYNGMFAGKVSIQPDNGIIINQNNDNLEFRDMNDYTNILFSTILYNWRVSRLYDENYFVAFYDEKSRLYNYNVEAKTLTSAFELSVGNEVTCSNGIISVNATQKNSTEFFTVRNNQLVKIGEKPDVDRYVLFTYVYPEQKKMVQLAGSGLYIFDIDYTVSQSDLVSEINSTYLQGNYPNPFNPVTTIKFGIRNSKFEINSSHVTIDIFNVKGQKVRSLVDGVYPAGEHSVVWYGNDDSGRSVGSGIYFYKMQSENYTETKIMVLIK